jgi:hypothetical protein
VTAASAFKLHPVDGGPGWDGGCGCGRAMGWVGGALWFSSTCCIGIGTRNALVTDRSIQVG